MRGNTQQTLQTLHMPFPDAPKHVFTYTDPLGLPSDLTFRPGFCTTSITRERRHTVVTPSLHVTLEQWVSIVISVLTVASAWESFIGHYRSGFAVKMQYAPFLVMVVMAGAGITGLVVPVHAGTVLQVAGWLGLVAGAVGVVYHHYYGIVEKPAGYRWLLHHVMYHAPPLAPLILAALGALALLVGGASVGMSVPQGILVVCTVTILGAAVQSGISHYRGAYNNPLMYVPVTVPFVTVVALVWQALAPSALGARVAIAVLWITFVIGCVGFGMHLRGVDRQMGGLHIPVANLMQGPPVSAPLTFAGFAAAALAALYSR